MVLILKKNPKKLSKKRQLDLIRVAIKRWKKAIPEPRCELYYESTYQLLVSVVLSAQTTDKMVNRCMTDLYQKGFTPDDALKLKESGIKALIQSIGLANTKAKNIYNLTHMLIKNHGGAVPSSREALESLPGVGRKTANVILGEIFHQPTLAVDTHVFRVAFRLGLHKEKTPEKAEKVLLRLFDPRYLPKAHHWLILHGRYVCKAKNPDCENCCLNDLCPSIQS